jgi:hypothetical protein
MMSRTRGIKSAQPQNRTDQRRISTEPPKACPNQDGRRAAAGRDDGLCSNCGQIKDTKAPKKK